MEVPLTTLLKDLLSKIDSVDKQKQALSQHVADLSLEVKNLKADIARLQQELEKVSSQKDFLIYSHRLADTPNALALTRRHINTIIRRLDAAIEKLEEDPAL
ncbi:MAG: hypothetical protein NC328_08060 [Muribaculum sp.]|nr:hypothetical protein [Muribaculum sp.]